MIESGAKKLDHLEDFYDKGSNEEMQVESRT